MSYESFVSTTSAMVLAYYNASFTAVTDILLVAWPLLVTVLVLIVVWRIAKRFLYVIG